jgi:hypothetical protein
MEKMKSPDPGHRQIGQHAVRLHQPVELGRGPGRLDDVAVRQDHALGLARRAGGIEHHAGVVVAQRRDPPVQFRVEPLMRRAPLGLHILDPVEAGMVVFPHPPLVDIEDLVDVAHPVLDLEHLVHLLLVAADHEARAAVVKDIGHLLGHRVLVERHGDRARRLRRHHRPVKLRPVAPDDGDIVALRHAEREEPQRQRPDLGLGLGPGPALPDAEFLLAVGGPPAPRPGVPRE